MWPQICWESKNFVKLKIWWNVCFVISLNNSELRVISMCHVIRRVSQDLRWTDRIYTLQGEKLCTQTVWRTVTFCDLSKNKWVKVLALALACPVTCEPTSLSGDLFSFLSILSASAEVCWVTNCVKIQTTKHKSNTFLVFQEMFLDLSWTAEQGGFKVKFSDVFPVIYDTRTNSSLKEKCRLCIFMFSTWIMNCWGWWSLSWNLLDFSPGSMIRMKILHMWVF